MPCFSRGEGRRGGRLGRLLAAVDEAGAIRVAARSRDRPSAGIAGSARGVPIPIMVRQPGGPRSGLPDSWRGEVGRRGVGCGRRGSVTTVLVVTFGWGAVGPRRFGATGSADRRGCGQPRSGPARPPGLRPGLTAAAPGRPRGGGGSGGGGPPGRGPRAAPPRGPAPPPPPPPAGPGRGRGGHTP